MWPPKHVGFSALWDVQPLCSILFILHSTGAITLNLLLWLKKNVQSLWKVQCKSQCSILRQMKLMHFLPVLKTSMRLERKPHSNLLQESPVLMVCGFYLFLLMNSAQIAITIEELNAQSWCWSELWVSIADDRYVLIIYFWYDKDLSLLSICLAWSHNVCNV